MSRMSELHAAINGADPFMSLCRMVLESMPGIDLFDMLADAGFEPPTGQRAEDQMRERALVLAATDPSIFVSSIDQYIRRARDVEERAEADLVPA